MTVDGIGETIEPLVVPSDSATDPALCGERDCAVLVARSALRFAMALSLALFQLIDEGDEVVFIGIVPATLVGVSMGADSALTLTSLCPKRTPGAALPISEGVVGASLFCAPLSDRDRFEGSVVATGSNIWAESVVGLLGFRDDVFKLDLPLRPVFTGTSSSQTESTSCDLGIESIG